MSCLRGLRLLSAFWRLLLRKSAAFDGKRIWTLCALTLLVSGCAGSAALTGGLPPAPRTPGAIITNDYICIPHDEAAELLLWIERAETL